MAYLGVAAAILGLCVSWYLHRKKRAKKKMICPLRANCDKVIHSTHAHTLGIPNELLGIAYYFIVAFLYSLLIFAPGVFAVPIVFWVIAVMTMIGVLFTAYLIVIQSMVLRAWCSWCLLSAVATTLLAICALTLDFI